ncbi:hypothetical protein DA096_06965 [Vibrio rotiferianus]|nr:hypothetical protein DA095_08475 [Vibrio rotiferianus]TMX67325.1 hypothetical protein DA096_06965 [Vibrio rotiferianus]
MMKCHIKSVNQSKSLKIYTLYSCTGKSTLCERSKRGKEWKEEDETLEKEKPDKKSGLISIKAVRYFSL